MQKSLNKEKLKNSTIVVGTEEMLVNMPQARPHGIFEEEVLDFLDAWSKKIMKNRACRAYPDVVTLGFWIRKASLLEMKKRWQEQPGEYPVGRGMLFHIAPSNVPVNCMYSLITGLLAGNANVVKIPSKDFEQLPLITQALQETLDEMPQMAPYIVLIRYGHEKDVTDELSRLADGRIVWGGDRTIWEIRKSPLQARAVEVDFADRYSLSVIDAETYLQTENKQAVAQDFYNDTFLSDQNACTSPRVVVWVGKEKEQAKELFWKTFHDFSAAKYTLQPVQAVNKLTSAYLATQWGKVQKVPMPDNLIFRMKVDHLDDDLMEWKENSGFFFEYDCDDIKELLPFCDNTHCQTLGYLGAADDVARLIGMHPRGIDRAVPIGKTMDFEFIWDGYDLISLLTRTVKIN